MAADALGPRGRLVGADLSLPMLRGALAKVGARPIRLAAMDGQALACRAEAFDAVICQLGLMFFPDPLAGLREARRVLRPGGGFAAVVSSTPDPGPWGGPLALARLARFPHRPHGILRG